MSLSSSLDLVVRNHWSGVELEHLVTSQLAHFRTLIGDRIHLGGPRVVITPGAAQNIGMALHELATNATKYGALSGKAGNVAIGWSIQEGVDGRVLRLSWTETDGPAVVTPRRRGFGTLVITRMLRSSINGKVALHYDASGLRWSIDAPVSAVVAP
jgi:two-component sensor histidine kinase